MLRTWNWRFDSPVEKCTIHAHLYHRTLALKGALEAIWSVLADTARFNEAAEIPKHEIEEIAQPDGSVRYVGRGRFGLLTYRWDEKPVNWVHQRWFEHCRYFHGSPFESICARLELVAESAGCRGAYTMDIVPRNALGRLMLSSGLLSRIERTFNALADDARQYCRGQRDTEFDCKPPELTAGAARRARELVARIEESAHGQD